VTRLTKRTTALLVATIACALPVGSAQADPTTENLASAVIEQDDGRAFDLAWDISRQHGVDVVDHRNEARARASCLRCEATAIAFQIVLVTGTPTPSVVTPVNIADAQNIGCTECVSSAHARQFVRVVPEEVRFTDTGRDILADVRTKLRALEAQQLPADQQYLTVEEQEARVEDVLDHQLVLKSDPDTEAEPAQQRVLEDADLG
jgi:hypothetical protein